MVGGGLNTKCICISYIISHRDQACYKYIFYKKDLERLTNSEVKSICEIEMVDATLFSLLLKNIDIVKYEEDIFNNKYMFIFEEDFYNYIFPHFEKVTF